MSTVKNFPQLAHQRTRCKRFLQKCCPWFQYPVMDNRMICVARHVNDLHLGSQRGQFVSQLTSTHEWHHNVGQQQVNRALVADGHSKCFSTMISFQHGVAIFLEYGTNQIPHGFLVFNQQDRLRPMR